MRVKVNDNFNSIRSYIRQADHIVSKYELLEYVTDYDMFKEYYLNYHLFIDLLNEHNEEFMKGNWTPVA